MKIQAKPLGIPRGFTDMLLCCFSRNPVLCRLYGILAPGVILLVLLRCLLIFAIDGMALDGQFLALRIAGANNGVGQLARVILLLTGHDGTTVRLRASIGKGCWPRLWRFLAFATLIVLGNVVLQYFLIEVTDDVRLIVSLIRATLLIDLSVHTLCKLNECLTVLALVLLNDCRTWKVFNRKVIESLVYQDLRPCEAVVLCILV